MPLAWPVVIRVEIPAPVPLVAATQAEVLELTIPSVPDGARRILLEAVVHYIPGTAATAVALGFRKVLPGSTPLVGEFNIQAIEVAVGQITDMEVLEQDNAPGDVAGLVYRFVMQQTAATGDGSCERGYVQAIIV